MPKNLDKPAIAIDTSPLTSMHAARGIGTYTRLLIHSLEELETITLIKSGAQQSSAPKPQLIHYPFFDFFSSTLPITLKTPTVVTIHDVIPLKFPAYYKPGVRGTFAYARQKLVLKTVSAVITDSQSSKTDIAYHLGVPKEKIHVVYLAAHPELRKQNEATVLTVRQKYQLPENYLLYVGDINYNKNLPQLIKSLKFMPDSLHLVCVGKNFTKQTIPEWQWIETQIALSDVSDRVHFITDVLQDDLETLGALYSGALCYVQPSLYEGFGLPVLESMQCRTPVVCAANSSLIEVGREHAIFTGTTAEEIAAGITEVTQWSKTHREKVIAGAFAWSQTFSWQQTASETAAVYMKVLHL